MISPSICAPPPFAGESGKSAIHRFRISRPPRRQITLIQSQFFPFHVMNLHNHFVYI